MTSDVHIGLVTAMMYRHDCSEAEAISKALQYVERHGNEAAFELAGYGQQKGYLMGVVRLYTFTIEIADGEQEYYYKHLVAASSIEDATDYAQEYLSSFFGEDTIRQGRVYWDEWQTRTAKLEQVEEVQPDQYDIVPGTDGSLYDVSIALGERR